MSVKPRYLDSNYGYYYSPQINVIHSKPIDNFKSVKCPKCNYDLKLIRISNIYKYVCAHCKYIMRFSEYQKRYNNINWNKIIKKGISLYSWKDNCPNCKSIISYISYCINANFGDESLFIFKPILLGKCNKIDSFIMNVCNVVNMFPDNNNLSAHIFCIHCDAPISYNNLEKSFLNQTKYGLEYTIKQSEITNINLEPEDVNKLLNYLERY
ncbi:MAG: hypothetical protein H9897_02515 [Candidatus Ureaplasma intestinipullorum]|uniref:Uncharacterized protein n=1 Tax=Candidatus Ureaplasma intestinipullorum TaxID=2838770 RepID=A0A9E2NXX3_9BACT|nr:hypothetical protein [Candidatus Ureaplasma intestinipullorum]